MKIIWVSVLLVLSGCSTVHYPSEWIAIDAKQSSSDCALIAAQFSQHGVAQKTKGAFWNRTEGPEASEFSDLLGIDVRPVDAVTRITLMLSALKPSLTLWIGDELLLTRNLQPGELICESGRWQLDVKTEIWGSSGIMLDGGATFTSLLLQQAVDGSLVVRRTQKMVGTAVLLPIYIQVQDWHRFTLATDTKLQMAPNAPHGVLPRDLGFARLLPPSTQKHRDENAKSQNRCLKLALEKFELQGGNLTPEEKSRLGGRSTQAFLAQRNKRSNAYTMTEFLDRTRGHTPTTRNALMRKPNWLDPSISDRYVLCLLDAGYIWEEVKRTVDTHLIPRHNSATLSYADS